MQLNIFLPSVCLQCKQGCILINIGDVLMHMTDDRLKSNFHRIPAPNADRFQGRRVTMAFFTNPNLNATFQVQVLFADA